MYLLISSSIHHLFLNLQTFQNVFDSSMIHKRLYVGKLSVEGLQHAVDSMKKNGGKAKSFKCSGFNQKFIQIPHFDSCDKNWIPNYSVYIFL